MPPTPLTPPPMETVMRDYYDGCNEADAAKTRTCSAVGAGVMRNFTPAGTHYFPPGMYDGPFRGAAKIAERWQAAVASLGSWWTIDTLVIDEPHAQAVTPHLPCRWGQVSS